MCAVGEHRFTDHKSVIITLGSAADMSWEILFEWHYLIKEGSMEQLKSPWNFHIYIYIYIYIYIGLVLECLTLECQHILSELIGWFGWHHMCSEIILLMSDWQYIIIGSVYGLAFTKYQAIIWTNDYPGAWCNMSSLSHSELTLNVPGLSYLFLTSSKSWLLMSWLLTLPGHQQPWYWPCRIGRSLSYLRKGFKYLCHINVEEWHKMWIYVLCSFWKF